MADGTELRSIAWSEAFPFVRLFRTLDLALNANRLVLALLCVIVIYLGGRIFDAAWLALDSGVPRASGAGGRVVSALEVYAAGTQADYNAWQSSAKDAREKVAAAALVAADRAKTTAEAEALLAGQSLERVLLTEAHEKEVREALGWIRERVKQRVDALGKADLSAEQKAERRAALYAAADVLRLALHAHGAGPDLVSRRNEALTELFSEEPTTPEPEGAAAGRSAETKRGAPAPERRKLMRLLEIRARLAEYRATAPRGPFISLLDYEARCFAAAVQGVCAGRFGFGGGVDSAEPSLAGGIAAALRGVAWTVIHRPCFAALYGLFHFAVFALFGGAICRSAALQAARDQRVGLGEALRFARDKFSGLLLAPLMPVLLFVAGALVLAVGGLIGAIPWLGQLVAGALYFLALLGGLVLALLFLATVLGFHLMWPTIAVEASEAFDALTRAYNYLTSRIWHVAFYSFVLLVHGALAFVLARVLAALTLKFAHTFTGLCMNWGGAAELSGLCKLDAMWAMPAWADLPILPSTGATPFWGEVLPGPVSGTEWVGGVLIAVWVFLLVALLGAFAVSYFFCGSTQMYFLLRRDVDATDFEDVYYEEPADELPPVAPETSAPAGGAAPPAEPAPPSDGGTTT